VESRRRELHFRVGTNDDVERIAEAGFGEAELHTMVGNQPALGSYASAGWQLTDRLIHGAHDGVECDEHVLVERLDVTTARRDVVEKTSPRKADPA